VAEQHSVVTEATLAAAAACAGLSFTDAERALMLKGVQQFLTHYEQIRAVPIDNSVAPALAFDPRLAGATLAPQQQPGLLDDGPAAQLPSSEEELAFATVATLSRLLRSRQVTSTELTELYLRRLERYDAALHCVVTLTGELALEQARRADAEQEHEHHRPPSPVVAEASGGHGFFPSPLRSVLGFSFDGFDSGFGSSSWVGFSVCGFFSSFGCSGGGV